MSSTATALRDEKKALRKSMKAKLAKITQEDAAEQSSRITNKVLKLPAYREAKHISVFLSMPTGEVSTHDIVLNAMNQGKKVFVPFIHRSREVSNQRFTSVMDMLALHSREDFESLKLDSWEIPTLEEDTIANRENALSGFGIDQDVPNSICDGSKFLGLDLVLVPGVAFDKENGRLGHGKGFYDRYLQRYKDIVSACKETRMPFLVGLALAEQMLPYGTTVPSDTDDWKLDHVVTGAAP